MATVQKMQISDLSSASCYVACRANTTTVPDQFPAGLRVLVVDDDTLCLKVLEQMLRKCLYNVTTCSRATIALSLLRERKGGFDVVISDVYMPDMDGYKLLEHVGLEMDLPVIMMSADARTSAVMRGIKHGACDYLIKPVRIEELKNIWQHVIRKKWNENKEIDHSGIAEDTDRRRQVGDDEYASSVNEGTDGSWKVQKKRNTKEDEDDDELDNDDSSTTKKPRVVWSVELHQQFVSAVNQLGIDKAVPKRILELMNVPGLTRENVASHLQKFRLYLKRLSGVTQHQSGIPSSFCGPAEPSGKLGSLGRIDIHALAASGQIPPQTLAALHADLLGRPTGSLVLPTMDQAVLPQASLQGGKCVPVDRGVAFGQPLIKCESNAYKHFPQPTPSVGDNQPSFATWTPNHLGAVGLLGNLGVLNMQNNAMLVLALKQQQQQLSAPPESTHAISVQPSCVVVPSQSSSSFQSVTNAMPTNNSSRFINTTPTVNFNALPEPNSMPMGSGHLADSNSKNAAVLCGYSIQDALICPPVSSSVHAERGAGCRMQNSSLNIHSASRLSGTVPNTFEIPGSLVKKMGMITEEGLANRLGFVGKGMSIPSRFAVDDIELPADELCPSKVGKGNGGSVKQELNSDFLEAVKGSIPMLRYSQRDLMSVLSK